MRRRCCCSDLFVDCESVEAFLANFDNAEVTISVTADSCDSGSMCADLNDTFLLSRGGGGGFGDFCGDNAVISWQYYFSPEKTCTRGFSTDRLYEVQLSFFCLFGDTVTPRIRLSYSGGGFAGCITSYSKGLATPVSAADLTANTLNRIEGIISCDYALTASYTLL